MDPAVQPVPVLATSADLHSGVGWKRAEQFDRAISSVGGCSWSIKIGGTAISEDDAQWRALQEFSTPEGQKLLSLLEPSIRERRLPVPDVGFELTGSKDQVLAEAELAWPSQLLAVVLQPEDQDAFEQAGWRCWLIDDSPDSITNSLLEAL